MRPSAGFWAVVVMALAPLLHVLGIGLLPDTLLMFFTALVMWQTLGLMDEKGVQSPARWLALGLVLGLAPLVQVGIWMFALMAVFQLVTLPVEFNASARALATLERENYLEPSELRGARKVLQAAALTYVAALLVTVMQLLRLVLLFGNRRRD